MKILTLVDFQNDFVAPGGALTFDNGCGDQKLIDRMAAFFEQMPQNYFDAAVVTYDTHDPKIYADTEEGKTFPLHCAIGTNGWNLAINPDLIARAAPIVQHLKKDTYDMWRGIPDRVDNLFLQQPAEVTIVGVASDICNRAAMEGWLQRGATVTIIDDLTRGIFKQTNDVVAEKTYRIFVAQKRLRVTNLANYFKSQHVRY